MVGHFIKVKCSKCNNEQNIFDKSTTVIKCVVCNEILAEPTGGKTDIKADIIKKL